MFLPYEPKYRYISSSPTPSDEPHHITLGEDDHADEMSHSQVLRAITEIRCALTDDLLTLRAQYAAIRNTLKVKDVCFSHAIDLYASTNDLNRPNDPKDWVAYCLFFISNRNEYRNAVSLYKDVRRAGLPMQETIADREYRVEPYRYDDQ